MATSITLTERNACRNTSLPAAATTSAFRGSLFVVQVGPGLQFVPSAVTVQLGDRVRFESALFWWFLFSHDVLTGLIL